MNAQNTKKIILCSSLCPLRKIFATFAFNGFNQNAARRIY